MKSYKVQTLPVLIFCLAVLAAVGWLWLASGQAARAEVAAPAAGTLYPNGTILIPLGPEQPELRHAYNEIFRSIYERDAVAWAAAPAQYQGTDYPAGTILAPGDHAGDFNSQPNDGSYNVKRAHVLQPVRIAVLYSSVRDGNDQVVTWEEATFETMFRVYLWGWATGHEDEYFYAVSEADVAAGQLGQYDVLLLPSVTIGYVDEVVAALGTQGLERLAAWVEKGGTLYAQGDGAYLVEAAGLAPAGTVNLNARLTDRPPYDNLASLDVLSDTNALGFSWLTNQTYILDDPVLYPSAGLDVIAEYIDTTHPGTPAILYKRQGAGEIILTNAHPSALQSTYPQVFDAVFLAMSERAGLSGRLKQMYSPNVPDDLIPAYEAGVALSVTVDLRNYWDTAIPTATLTEKIDAGFVLDVTSIAPAPSDVVADPGQPGVITWDLTDVPHGVNSFTYVVRTLTDTLASGSAFVCSGMAEYVDPFTGLERVVYRAGLYVRSQMAGRLNGDRDIELDGLYPLPAQGYYFDIALTLENKEETDVHNTVITDVVALISPIVDVDDQRLIPSVLTDTTIMTATGETIWVANEVFFYNNANYPLPRGVKSNLEVIDLTHWDGKTWYTYTNELSNTVTIPAGFAQYIKLNPDGSIRLPAAVLRWDFGDLQGYDYLDPAVRYGIFSQELKKRTVSFASDPFLHSGVVLNGSGGSVFTNLGGDPIPYHEYLSSGIISIPVAPYKSEVTYQDVWNRVKSLELRTVFYDIVPFPPPEYHAVVNTTFQMHADFDGDGVYTDPVLEYPSRVPVALDWMLKTHSNFDPRMPPLRKDETLISQGLFRGLGFTLLPANGDWASSWSFRDLQGKGPDATVLTDVIETPAYTYLYFQQELDSQAFEVIDINGMLDASNQHSEGVMKINDGARFVYHQKAVGPSRYEVFDSHVQAVFGLRSDAEVSKLVAPVRVATYGDTVYHFIKVEDPWEPRLFTADPFIQSYGFGDMAATVYVGGRHQRVLLWSRVNPGESTQVRIEINNNTGAPITNVSLVPNPPDGVQVTLRTYSETTAIEPLFFDFPFLNAEVISDAWKGVYYFDVDVDAAFALERGKVYPISFTLQADSVPAGFQIPAAQLGIKDDAGNVYTVWGKVADLSLKDRLPPWAVFADARIANEAEMDLLVDYLNTGDPYLYDDGLARGYYETLRDGITTTVVTSTEGSNLDFGLPPYAQMLPWQDGDQLAKTLYIIVRSDMNIDWSGTAIADYEPEVGFTDSFDQRLTATGNLQTVESHGAALTITYRIADVNGNWVPGDPLPVGEQSQVTINGHLVNTGDDIAADTLITYTLPVSVTPVSAVPVWRSLNGNVVTWYLGDLGPGVQRDLALTVAVAPTLADYGKPVELVNDADAYFYNTFAARFVSADVGDAFAALAGGELEVYFNDFESGAGGEWSNPWLDRTPSGRGFLGQFANDTVTLDLSDLPAHTQVTVAFDLYILLTWDGNQADYEWPQEMNYPDYLVGPDLWSFRADGRQLVQTTFANWDALGFRQAYPGPYPGGNYAARAGAVENNTLGYMAQTAPMDSVYHLVLTFPHTGATLSSDFLAAGLQGVSDEPWGLDNVRVTISSYSLTRAVPRYFLPIIAR